jgi:hypothetical protein
VKRRESCKNNKDMLVLDPRIFLGNSKEAEQRKGKSMLFWNTEKHPILSYVILLPLHKFTGVET